MTTKTEDCEIKIGIKMLDRDHREMTEAIQRLKDCIVKGSQRNLTASLLRKLEQFSLTHFALEEGMMAATNYPWMDLHRVGHLCFTGQLTELIARCERADFMPNDPSIEYLSEAHFNHLQKDDLLYGLWLNQCEVN